jgi:hypothetical protein
MASQITKPVFQPTGTSIQYGDLVGNISHTGILGSNISLTTPLSSTFPTTNTGDSLGHYHYTEDGTGALKFLNVCGTGTGGHQFFTSNSTTAPFKTATIDQYGMTIDKSTGGIVLVNLPALINATATQCVFTYPPGLDTFGIQFGVYNNPVQVLFNSGPFITGVTYYAQAPNAQSLCFRTTTNPSDPLLDCSSFSSGQIPWAFVQSNTPIVTTTTNMNENLTVTNNTNVSILTATDLTFNTVSLKTQVSTNTTDISSINSVLPSLENLIITQKTTTNQYISAAITADGRPPTAPTSTITQQYAFTPAWYFKNTVSGYKINWYMGGDIGMTVSQVLGLYMSIFNPSMTSNDNCPFITVYTVNDTPSPPNFYKSKRTYLFNQSVTPVVNTRYFMFQNVSGTCPTPFYYGSVLNNMQLSTVSGSNIGAFGPTEVILAFAIGTNSASAVNSVEFAINKFGIMTPYGTQEVSFIPST